MYFQTELQCYSRKNMTEVDVIKLILIARYFQQVQEHFYLIYHLNSRLGRTDRAIISVYKLLLLLLKLYFMWLKSRCMQSYIPPPCTILMSKMNF